MKHFTVVLLSLVLANCASGPRLTMTDVAIQEAARLAPPAVMLSKYNKFELKKMTMSPDVAAHEEKVRVVNELDSKLQSKLMPLLSQWEINAKGKDSDEVLIIEPSVQSLRIVSGGARFWIGAWAGDSEVDMDLILSDGESGDKIATPRVNRDADAMAGAWTVGSTDRNLLDYIVEISYQYLLDNYQ